MAHLGATCRKGPASKGEGLGICFFSQAPKLPTG